MKKTPMVMIFLLPRWRQVLTNLRFATNLIGARLQYMKFGELRLEGLAIKDADFSNRKINLFALRQVKTDGKVEFANTVIAHKQAEA